MDVTQFLILFQEDFPNILKIGANTEGAVGGEGKGNVLPQVYPETSAAQFCIFCLFMGNKMSVGNLNGASNVQKISESRAKNNSSLDLTVERFSSFRNWSFYICWGSWSIL